MYIVGVNGNVVAGLFITFIYMYADEAISCCVIITKVINNNTSHMHILFINGHAWQTLECHRSCIKGMQHGTAMYMYGIYTSILSLVSPGCA